MFKHLMLSLLTPALIAAPVSASSFLGLSSPPLHIIVAVDMTGSSKNPAYQYAQQARLIAQNVLLNQVRGGDSLTLLNVCGSVKTIADFKFQASGGAAAGGARLSKSDILRYANAVTAPCTGKGSAITAGFAAAQAAAARDKAPAVIVYFTDGALIDDSRRAELPAVFAKLLGRGTVSLFVAGLSPEKLSAKAADSSAGSIRDEFTAQLGKSASDKRVILAGAYDLANVYPAFANAVKEARQ